ncbi:MAG: NADH-quinone oxidoreductase subunit NuoK [Elusimicrobiales bacterium]|jgi:NADH-quinone oxidoreductase subunit K
MPFEHLLVLSFVLFTLAAAGFLTHRNIIVLLMFAELMLNAANIMLVAFSRSGGAPDPQVFVLMVFAVAAAEAGVGLAIVILLARNLGTLNIGLIKNLRG